MSKKCNKDVGRNGYREKAEGRKWMKAWGKVVCCWPKEADRENRVGVAWRRPKETRVLRVRANAFRPMEFLEGRVTWCWLRQMGPAFLWDFLFKSPFYSPFVLHSYFVIVLIVSPGPLWTDSVLTGCMYACVLLLLVIVSQNQCALLKLFFLLLLLQLFTFRWSPSIKTAHCGRFTSRRLGHGWPSQTHGVRGDSKCFATQFQNLNWCVYCIQAC